ncbi:hypothetical protein ACFYT7_26940 [Streptomyces sp. NPDC004041]|uniref:hypothetical protein n=1 Tax=Streptomyces sp. NPDC004041 TaxID=3364688 RepID=UPI00368C8335
MKSEHKYHNHRSQIASQGGDIYGDVHFDKTIHYHGTTVVSRDDPPEKRFDAGVEELRSGKRSSAERLISKAVTQGYVTDRTVYYWLLSILSKRLFEQLEGADINALRRAFQLLSADVAPAHGPDKEEEKGFLAAALAIKELVLTQAADPTAADRSAVWSGVQELLNGLPPERSSEIRQHLNMLMHRALRDSLEAKEREEIGEKRHEGKRAERAPKFFIPDPRPLVLRVAVPPAYDLPRRIALGVSAALPVAGVVWAVVLMTRQSWTDALLALVLWGAAGYALAVSLPRRLWLVRRRLRAAYEHSPFHAMRIDTSGRPETVNARAAFWREMYTVADRWFQDQLQEGESEHQWRLARIGPQVALANDLTERYGPPVLHAPPVAGWWSRTGRLLRQLGVTKTKISDPYQADAQHRYEVFTSSVKGQATVGSPDPGAYQYHTLQQDGMTSEQQTLGWLIKMHAQDVAARWRAGTLWDFRRTLRPSVAARLLTLTGFVAALAAVVWTATVLLVAHPLPMLGITALIAVGTWSAWRQGYPLARAAFDYRADQEKYAAQGAAEAEARQGWVDHLSDRPSDAEMATWLDYDQRALRMAALDNYGLTNWEVINSFFLLEAADGCKRARVLNGPPRYSAYVVRLFILTEDGVWYNMWPLDFLSGQEHSRYDETFRYEVIARCRVTETGLYHQDGRREWVRLEADGSLASGSSVKGGQRDLILSQTLQLELMHGESIHVLIDNFGRFLDKREDVEALMDVAMEVSGATDAVRILQAVGGGGKDWFRRQRERARFRLTELVRTGPELPSVRTNPELPSVRTNPELPSVRTDPELPPV